ncbi:MAG TPA: Gfo/Idh/MocA family oxidoreductase [Bacteroidales bacterium]|nr:Gfo/Idh/MocA family oxidoreductase [Bacteroidales bacterium]
MNRRVFLRNSGIAIAGAYIIPLTTGCSKKHPNDLINIGMIGTGSQGIERNLKLYLKYPELCRVVAVCDVYMPRATSAKNLVNNTYKSKDCKAYQDFRELLADKSIDAVQISTPDHWHVPISIMAALKGKHVCSEKPTLTIDEGRLLCDVINKKGVVYQVSVEDRFEPVYHKMAEVALNGRLGALRHLEISLPVSRLPAKDLEVTAPPKDLDFDLWLGPAPVIPYIYSRTFSHFRWYDAFSGGLLTDWGAHYCDTAQLVTGNEFSGPIEVAPAGETLYYNDGIFNTAYQFDLQYKYANNISMRVKNGNGFVASIRLEGDEGWVESVGWNNELVASNDKILDLAEKKVVLPTANNEIINFLESIKSGRKAIYTPESGHRTSSLLHCGNIALKLNRKLEWDPLNESFINDPEAEKFKKREMREMWSYSKICPEYKY